MISDVEHLFVCLMATVYPLGKNIYSDPLPSFKLFEIILMLDCMSSSYIVYFNPLLDVLFGNIFYSLGCLLFCWWFPSLCKSFLVWYNPICLFLLLLSLLGWHIQKILFRWMSETLLLRFYSWSLMVSSLAFKCLIHFELIFVYGVREWSVFIFFVGSCPVFATPFIKVTVFPSLYILASFVLD